MIYDSCLAAEIPESRAQQSPSSVATVAPRVALAFAVTTANSVRCSTADTLAERSNCRVVLPSEAEVGNIPAYGRIGCQWLLQLNRLLQKTTAT